MRSFLVWSLPFLVSGGMALGALIGINLFWGVTSQEAAASDMQGAAGALMVLISIVAGFTVSMPTVIIVKVFLRRTFDRYFLRLGMSVLGGIFISAMGISEKEFMVVLTWFLLISFPIVCSCPWPLKLPPDTEQ